MVRCKNHYNKYQGEQHWSLLFHPIHQVRKIFWQLLLSLFCWNHTLSIAIQGHSTTSSTADNIKQVGAQAQNATNVITLTGRRLFFICSEHYLKLFLLVTLENDEYTSGWHALEYMHIINIFSATAFRLYISFGNGVSNDRQVRLQSGKAIKIVLLSPGSCWTDIQVYGNWKYSKGAMDWNIHKDYAEFPTYQLDYMHNTQHIKTQWHVCKTQSIHRLDTKSNDAPAFTLNQGCCCWANITQNLAAFNISQLPTGNKAPKSILLNTIINETLHKYPRQLLAALYLQPKHKMLLINKFLMTKYIRGNVPHMPRSITKCDIFFAKISTNFVLTKNKELGYGLQAEAVTQTTSTSVVHNQRRESARYQLKWMAKQINYKTMAVTAQWKNCSSLIQLTKLTIIKVEKTRSLSQAHVFVRLSVSSISNVEHYA